MKAVRSDWNEFLFSLRPASPLGLFRIVFGLIIFAWCLLIAPDLKVWYSEGGLVNLDAMRAWGMNPNGFDLLAMHYWAQATLGVSWFRDVTDFRITQALFALLMVSTICFTIGYRTRVATIVMWALLTSFHHRCLIILNGGDTMQRNIAFLMMFADAGAACSVDRLIAIARGKEMPDSVPMMEMWPVRLLQLQISAVYISSVASKMEGAVVSGAWSSDWLNGNAFYFAIHLADLNRFPLFGLQNQSWFYGFMTYFTLFTEFSLGTFIWVPRARKYVIALGMLLHAGIEYSMTVPLFSFTMVGSYLTFASSNSVDIAVCWIRRKLSGLEVTMPANAALPGRLAQLLPALDAFRLLRYDDCMDSKLDAKLAWHILWRLPLTWLALGALPLLVLVICPIRWYLISFDVVWPIVALTMISLVAGKIAALSGATPNGPTQPTAQIEQDGRVAPASASA